MELTLTNEIQKLASIDLFSEAQKSECFVGRPFALDYDRAFILVADAWKLKVGGIPQGAFLLAFYVNEDNVSEALLLRVLKPTKLPTDNDVISSMVEHYKDNLKTSGKDNKLDDFTRYEFSFSGLECRVLGTFYKTAENKTVFGADVENFYSAHNYAVYKPKDKVLELIVNFREGNFIPGNAIDVKIGKVRYSSSSRFQAEEKVVPAYVTPSDFLGKRTALFGMTRTGKSNTVKKIIQSTVLISEKAKGKVNQATSKPEENLEPFDKTGMPKFPVGQIIFDINGEYANANLQDEGTAIFELYKQKVIRYSVIDKPDFKVMKVNFYEDVLSGFELVLSHLEEATGDYVQSFKVVDLSEPKDSTDWSAKIRYERKKAAYLCCLYRAEFLAPKNFKVKFTGEKFLNSLAGVDPAKGISLDQAVNWFDTVWDNYNNDFFQTYKNDNSHEWADEGLKSLLVFLTQKKAPGKGATVSGYLKLRSINNLHTSIIDKPYDKEIIEELRNGKIIIVDLSQGNPNIQRLYSERICQSIFADSMNKFIKNEPNNFLQFYFEEAHNLFPKKDDKDLNQIYNRIAKEGAKLQLGLIYATQEVSSISSNILKNTQNWFITHLNNEDETKELRKYYDFGDFTDGLIRFSAGTDKGFVRMKTYSNPFVVSVQIDKFSAKPGK